MRVEYRRGVSPDAIADLPDGCAAAVLTDPPYGTTGGANDGYGRRQADGTRQTIANDADLSQIEAVAPSLFRLLDPAGVALVFMAPTKFREASDVLEGAGFVVWHSLPWDKGAPGISYRGRFAYEDLILASRPDVDPWPDRGPIVLPVRFPRVQNTEHPNEKPVGLLRRYLAWACPNGGLVLDPFAGIASCGVAAVAQGCEYIGVECDPQWWPVAERRLAEVQNHAHAEIAQGSFFTDEAA